MLSSSIIATTASSASLVHSLRFRTSTYTESLCHSRTDPDCTPDLPQFTLRFLPYLPPSLPRRVTSLLLSVSSRCASVSPQGAGGRHPLLMSTPFSIPLCGKDIQPHGAAMFALCYGL